MIKTFKGLSKAFLRRKVYGSKVKDEKVIKIKNLRDSEGFQDRLF